MSSKPRNNRTYVYMPAQPPWAADCVNIQWDNPGYPGRYCAASVRMDDYLWGVHKYPVWGTEGSGEQVEQVELDSEDIQRIDELFARRIGVPGATGKSTRSKVKRATMWVAENITNKRYANWTQCLADSLKHFRITKTEFTMMYSVSCTSWHNFICEASRRFGRRLA